MNKINMGCNSSVTAVEGYGPSEKPKNKVLVVVGPSGVGKDTAMSGLFQKYPESFQKAVTHTSRAMRPGEEEGKNYYYVTKEDFEKLLKEDGLVEHNFYNGNYYGVSKKELYKASEIDKVMYLIIDINGANAIHNQNIPANFIAIVPPSFETLQERLTKRGTENEEIIKGRLETAKKELDEIEKTPFFNYKVVNDNLEKTVEELSEKMKILYPDLIQ